MDEYDGDDGNDHDVPALPLEYQPPPIRTLMAARSPDPHLAVPYVYLKRNSHGKPVIALVRALSVAGYGAWKGRLFSNLLGPFATKNLNAFKRKHGLPANGVYDKAAHQHLAPFYDAYAVKHLLNQPPGLSKEQKRRNAFLAELMFLYNRRTHEPYTQRRAFNTAKPPGGLDCSSSGEWAAKWAGLKSLSGYGGFGYGNTDSQIHRYRTLGAASRSIQDAEIGDPIYFGRGGDPSHVAFWIGAGRVWSFGAYPIKILQADYRHDRIAVCDLLAGQ